MSSASSTIAAAGATTPLPKTGTDNDNGSGSGTASSLPASASAMPIPPTVKPSFAALAAKLAASGDNFTPTALPSSITSSSSASAASTSSSSSSSSSSSASTSAAAGNSDSEERLSASKRYDLSALPSLSSLHSDWSSDPSRAFVLGMQLAFERFESLNMAVEEFHARGEGEEGDALREDIFENILEMFLKPANTKKQVPYRDELEEWLLSVMEEEMHITLEDESEKWMANLLVTLWTDVMKKKEWKGLEKMIEKRVYINEQIQKARKQRQNQQEQQQEEQEDEEETEETEEAGEGEEGEEDEEDEEEEESDEEKKDSDEKTIADAVGETQTKATSGSAVTDSTNQHSVPEVTESESKADDGWTTVPAKQRRGKGGK